MVRRQESLRFGLESRWLGGLPLVNAVLDRLRVDHLLARALPSVDARSTLAPAKTLGVLLRILIVNDRRPVNAQAEWASRAEPSLVGLAGDEAPALNEDRVGRSLDLLFV